VVVESKGRHTGPARSLRQVPQRTMRHDHGVAQRRADDDDRAARRAVGGVEPSEQLPAFGPEVHRHGGAVRVQPGAFDRGVCHGGHPVATAVGA